MYKPIFSNNTMVIYTVYALSGSDYEEVGQFTDRQEAIECVESYEEFCDCALFRESFVTAR